NRQLAITWEGDQVAVHSLAHVNRSIASRLVDRGHELSLIPTERTGDPTPTLPADTKLRECFCRQLSRPAEVHVRHQWPPQFRPPPAGAWVIMQHWEFGSLPRSWIAPMSQHVNEIWVASHWAQNCYIKSGIPADK